MILHYAGWCWWVKVHWTHFWNDSWSWSFTQSVWCRPITKIRLLHPHSLDIRFNHKNLITVNSGMWQITIEIFMKGYTKASTHKYTGGELMWLHDHGLVAANQCCFTCMWVDNDELVDSLSVIESPMYVLLFLGLSLCSHTSSDVDKITVTAGFAELNLALHAWFTLTLKSHFSFCYNHNFVHAELHQALL